MPKININYLNYLFKYKYIKKNLKKKDMNVCSLKKTFLFSKKKWNSVKIDG